MSGPTPAERATADQLAAAIAQLQHGLDALVTDRGYAVGTARDDPWLLAMVRQAAGADGGPPRLCRHVPAMRGPQPVYLAAITRRICCAQCYAADVEEMATSEEDLTCDRCRTIPADGRLAFAALHIGPVLVPLGLCPGCMGAIYAEPAP